MGNKPGAAAGEALREWGVTASWGALAGAAGATERSVTVGVLCARAGAISVATTGTSATVALAPIRPSLPRPPRAIERRNGARVTTLIAATPLRTC
jgi:hypothetical protein